MLAAVAIPISQYLIIASWHDAKFGTIANIIMLLATVVGFGTWNFARQYRNDVTTGLERTAAVPDSVLTEADILPLPAPVQQYLRYTGATGKPKVRNFKGVIFHRAHQKERTIAVDALYVGAIQLHRRLNTVVFLGCHDAAVPGGGLSPL